MRENKLTIFINKPVQEVFTYSLESNNVPKWITSIKQEIPLERPVKKGTRLKNIGVNSDTWNEYEVIDFEPNKTFTLKRLNGDYFVRYTCTENQNGTDFEYFEWAENGELDDLMKMNALELLKKNIENISMNMNVIAKLTNEDFGLEPKKLENYHTRKASRGIVIREDGKIAIQNKSNKNEYKLVGGGIEGDEAPSIAFKREVLEEAGCEVEIVEQLGIIEEERSEINLKQISYIFVARVTNDTHKLNLTEKEKSEGAKLLWVEPKEALDLIINCYDKLLPSDYENVYATRFVVTRDRKILEYYLANTRT